VPNQKITKNDKIVNGGFYVCATFQNTCQLRKTTLKCKACGTT